MDNLSDIKIVAHRGYAAKYPENSLSGIVAAAEAGAEAVEFDIQASRDGHPVVFHDDTLIRVTGVKAALEEYDAEVLSRMSAHEPSRLGDKFLPEPIACLETIVNALSAFPEVEVFAEIKSEVFERFGRQEFLTKVWRYLAPLKNHCTIISRDYRTLKTVKNDFGWPVGWVLSDYNSVVYDDAEKLRPEYLICNIKRLPEYPNKIWSGPWEWFVYDITDVEIAKQCIERDIRFIESWDFFALKTALEK